jgi:lysozyme family protein
MSEAVELWFVAVYMPAEIWSIDVTLEHNAMANTGSKSTEDLGDHYDPNIDGQILSEDSHDAVENQRPWRLAKALEALRDQVNAAFPSRSKASDGTIGDAAHASRPSDHNPGIIDGAFGVVTAIDITHDPRTGCDAGALAEALRMSQDSRIKYIISNRRIVSSSAVGAVPAWTWRAYTRPNPHEKHVHISVKAEKAFYDATGAWTLPTNAGRPEIASVPDTGPEENEAAIRAALAALGGGRRPLLATLLDAQDAVGVLLSRLADDTRAKAIDLEGGTEAAPALDDLRHEYRALWESCVIDPTKAGDVAFHRRKLREGRTHYEQVAARTRTPWWFIGIVHALEASFNFQGHLHNGDPLSARTVQVPRERPPQWNPPNDWASSAIDAITFDGNANIANMPIDVALYRFERYNGFGYHPRGLNSPYLWSFSNHYTRGKFVRDGVFDPNAVSKQCGAAVMLKALIASGDVSL